MGVTVDAAALTKLLYDNSGNDLPIEFRPARRPADADLLATFTDAVDRANRVVYVALPAEPEMYGAQTPALAVDRVLTFTKRADHERVLLRWADSVAESLTEAGWDGSIGPYLSSRRSEGSSARDLSDTFGLVTLLFTSGWTDQGTYGPNHVPVWRTDSNAASELVDLVDGWLGHEGVFKGNAAGSTIELERHQVVPHLTHALTADNSSQVRVSRRTGEAALYVYFRGHGHIAIVDVGVDSCSPAVLDTHRSRMLDAASWCEYALTRHLRWIHVTVDQIVNLLPPAPHNSIGSPPHRSADDTTDYYSSSRHMDRTHVPDAYGLQLFGPGHFAGLDAPLDPERWKTQPAGEMTLVESTNPDAWFRSVGRPVTDIADGRDLVDPHELARARAEFAPIILKGRNRIDSGRYAPRPFHPDYPPA